MSTKRSLQIAALSAIVSMTFALSPRAAAAAEIEGVKFRDSVRLADGTSLALTNVALMRYMLFKGLVAGLYVDNADSLLNVLGNTPKRLELEYFWNISAADFGNAAEEILRDNVDRQALARVQSRIDRMHAAYRDVRPGDRYSLTYIPGVGTELALNGQAIVTIPGDDFAAAYFSIWLGAEPMDDDLKAALLTLG